MAIMAKELVEREVIKVQQGRNVEWGHRWGEKD